MWIIKDWQGDIFPHQFETKQEAIEFLSWRLDDQGIDYDVVQNDYIIEQSA